MSTLTCRCKNMNIIIAVTLTVRSVLVQRYYDALHSFQVNIMYKIKTLHPSRIPPPSLDNCNFYTSCLSQLQCDWLDGYLTL